MNELRGRVAVVTGGANGIGLGLAARFLQEGMKVVVADNDSGDLARAEKELSELGEVLAVETDVADPDSVQALADATVVRFGGVHVLCNNAGVGGFQRFATTSLATWNWTLGVNLWGAVHGCHIFLPLLAAQDEAYIVNTASMSGFLTGPYLQPYTVSKAGVVALSEALANEFAKEYPHIGVAVLCPAYTSTSIRHDERNAPPGHVPRAQADPELAELRETVDTTIEQEGISAAEVAELVVAGMAARKTHIFPHPDWLDRWQERIDKVMAQA
ncbi:MULTISPECIES: SDR family NAD(P)-dependent oxidoreductase [unclassified Rhodococcus (in: high G+C Gram-positive bacteria)]|uniref:SDR family NAD(P)-dependent oxidoreductase n=1 Tax=unclassified Rhodococcus (in: high G+C Gram-positive bacteria) TaxID=192944 RepID=UPI00092B0D34|nr:SDR family NAD(P)-dependent oxidoreductase [Rhodococcus sp. M8]OLL18708.1 short-chain dehydrogenase [Rhodococcus sp. M8]QPG47394.1 SDR family NAD(P)-dependent oxidoreductase [Rhodococcus sp. M8]